MNAGIRTGRADSGRRREGGIGTGSRKLRRKLGKILRMERPGCRGKVGPSVRQLPRQARCPVARRCGTAPSAGCGLLMAGRWLECLGPQTGEGRGLAGPRSSFSSKGLKGQPEGRVHDITLDIGPRERPNTQFTANSLDS